MHRAAMRTEASLRLPTLVAAVAVATVLGAGCGQPARVDAVTAPPIATTVASTVAATTRPRATVPVASTSPSTAPSTTAPLPSVPSSTLGHRPAGLDQLALPAVVAPVRLRVPDLGIDAEVAAVSSTAEGEVVVPPSRELVAWYEHGPSPGDPGSAVLAAHVDWNGQPGVFFTLGDLATGASLVVVRADGNEVPFRIVSVERVAKSLLPVDQLFARDGPARLALVTCGGSFDSSRRRYDDNVIAWAEPA